MKPTHSFGYFLTFHLTRYTCWLDPGSPTVQLLARCIQTTEPYKQP